ncbi:hypothetical protein TNIN_423641 [Trichonephila inaurata madagascariensis]|uniref:Uncharacterized protein n=1 Tax=Trichonephila inaurata madagascariensis TaxID=2747483 RepID=A0A8X6YP64_9ARAC|nr:hypothetical protein TNIN_423641 [Trichonephila inaurata madagascariensis]
MEDIRGPLPKGQVCSSDRNNSLTSNSTQRCRSNDYCPYRSIILCAEDLLGIGSSSYLRPTAHQNNCFSEASQVDTSSTVNCCF